MKYILLLIALSLTSVIGLQIYYVVQVFLKEKETLKDQFDDAIENAVLDAESHRMHTVNSYHKADLLNHELVILEIRETENGRSIFLNDPKTGYYRMAQKLENDTIKKYSEEEMAELILKISYSFLEQNSIWFWTDTLGIRMKAYNDSIALNLTYLNQSFQSELQKHAIDGEFEIIYDLDTSKIVENPSNMLSKTMSIGLIKDSRIYANLLNPDEVILDRIKIIVLLTVCIISLILVSFIMLIRFANKQKKLSELKEDFIDNVTHELITPIATLKLALESQRNHQSDGTENKYLDISEQQTNRIANVIDHILTVSFVDQQRPGLKIEHFSINELIREVTEFYEVSMKKPVKLVVNTSQEFTIQNDRQHISNVLHNVISNAIKYGHENETTVTINLAQAKNQVHLTVADNGPGIPLSDQESIFDKFHRVSSGTHDVKGMGIGLYYCREILHQLGGQIELSESTRNGSIFLIKLQYVD